jgi:hypothetical protein
MGQYVSDGNGRIEYLFLRDAQRGDAGGETRSEELLCIVLKDPNVPK